MADYSEIFLYSEDFDFWSRRNLVTDMAWPFQAMRQQEVDISN